jgi:hypothetical protein
VLGHGKLAGVPLRIDAGEQLRLSCPAAAAAMAHTGEGVALDGSPPDRCLINTVYLTAADGRR